LLIGRAHELLTRAWSLRQHGGVQTLVPLGRTLGEVCLGTLRAEQGIEVFQETLKSMNDPVERGWVYMSLARLYSASLNTSEAWNSVKAGLKGLGRNVNENYYWEFFTVGVFSIGNFFLNWIGIEVRNEYQRRRYEVISRLYTQICSVLYFQLRSIGMVSHGLRGMWYGLLSGSKRSKLEMFTQLAIFCGIIKLEGLRRWFYNQAQLYVSDFPSPAIRARVALNLIWSYEFGGRIRDGEKDLRLIIEKDSQWLDAWDFTRCYVDLGFNLGLRGYATEGAHWVSKSILAQSKKDESSALAGSSSALQILNLHSLVMSGQITEGLRKLESHRLLVEKYPDDGLRKGSWIGAKTCILMEQRDIGQEFDVCVKEFDSLQLENPFVIPLHVRQFYIGQAYLALFRWQALGLPKKHSSYKLFKHALRQLWFASALSVIRTHYHVLSAWESFENKKFKKAQKQLDKAFECAFDADSPWGFWEISCLRSKIFQQLGNEHSAKREAKNAYHLALENQWPTRVRWVQENLAMKGSALSSTSLMGSTQHGRQTVTKVFDLESHRSKKNLEALLQVSLASTNVGDTFAVSKVALDELIKILGAERGFLFLLNESSGELVLEMARDSTGEALPNQGSYSFTVVQNVRMTMTPFVSTSDGANEIMTTCESIRSYNLKSIISAPILLKDQLVGVVYMDSTLARGVFTEENLEIVTALSNQVGISLETARVTKLELEKNALKKDLEVAAEIWKKNKEIESILSNIQQGVFMVGEDLKILPEYSAHLDRMVGNSNSGQLAGQNLFEVLFKGAELSQESVAQASEAVKCVVGFDSLAFDLNSHQLPTELVRNSGTGQGQTFWELEWVPMPNPEEINDRLMVCIRDVTELRKIRSEAEKSQVELQMIGQILKVAPERWKTFVESVHIALNECREMIRLRLNSKSAPESLQVIVPDLFLRLHTIKGNARSYGLSYLTEIVHKVEQFYADYRANPSQVPWQYETLLSDLDEVEGAVKGYEAICSNQLRGLMSRSQTDQTAPKNSVIFEPFEQMMAPLMESMVQTCREIGKAPVTFTYSGTRVAIHNKAQQNLESILTHIVRNSIDHGFAPDSASNEIKFHFEVSELGLWKLCYSDNGRGLNLTRLREKGKAAQNLDDKASEQQVAEVIFQSGLSTAEQVSELSGRGVGMDAVEKMLQSMGGKIYLQLRPDLKSYAEGYRPFEFHITLPKNLFVEMGDESNESIKIAA
jgi:two-component sensor histidine kinase